MLLSKIGEIFSTLMCSCANGNSSWAHMHLANPICWIFSAFYARLQQQKEGFKTQFARAAASRSFDACRRVAMPRLHWKSTSRLTGQPLRHGDMPSASVKHLANNRHRGLPMNGYGKGSGCCWRARMPTTKTRPIGTSERLWRTTGGRLSAN